MSLIIDLNPDVRERLEERAATEGVPPADLAARLIEHALPTAAYNRPQPVHLNLSYDEWKKRLREWQEMPRPEMPVLPPEAFERESLYEGR